MSRRPPFDRRSPAPQTTTIAHARRTLDLSIRASTGAEFVAYLRKHLLATHALLDPPLRELSLVIVGDARMSRLHERFMNLPGPTDVLTFPLDFDRRGKVTGGEVIVCLPVARRNARVLGIEARRELLLYSVHGLLHLCGFDDTTRRAFGRMHRMEDRILTKLGVGAVFRRHAPPAGQSLAAACVKMRRSPVVSREGR